MTHAEALKEMEELAGGRDWSFMYEIASYLAVPAIHGYIDLALKRNGHAQPATTYASAIENVKAMLGLVGCDPAPEDGEGRNEKI